MSLPSWVIRFKEEIMAENPWILPNAEPFASLADGTPLYHAYWPIMRRGQLQRAASWWDGAMGMWVAVTLEGRVYQQQRLWGNDQPRPDKWEEITLG